MVRIADQWMRPAELQTWGYNVEVHPVRLRWTANWQLCTGALLMAGAVIVGVVGPIFGIVRLNEGLPIGHTLDQIVQPAP
jgi:hypothetical protein